MIKAPLDWQTSEIVEIYDEVPLWSAPFGKILLENIPMQANWTIVDLGFGTGFPLIELAQRFGPNSTIIGVDIWDAAFKRVRKKIDRLKLSNVELINNNASTLSIADKTIDLVSSNLGVNNFENKTHIFQIVSDMLKSGGHFCLTTNDQTTFRELFELFEKAIMELSINPSPFQQYLDSRIGSPQVIEQMKDFDLELAKQVHDTTCMRFVSSHALFNHGLIRTAFVPTWKSIIPQDKWSSFIALITKNIEDVISRKGEFRMTIPITYLDFVKR